MPVHVKLINLHYSAQERTFMVGPHGGKWDTVKVDNFTGGFCSRIFCHPKLAFPLQPVSLLLVLVLADHIPDIFKFPDAEVPLPYTELLITAVPGYKKVAKGMLHHWETILLRSCHHGTVLWKPFTLGTGRDWLAITTKRYKEASAPQRKFKAVP